MHIVSLALLLLPLLTLSAYAESRKPDDSLLKDTIAGTEFVTVPAGCFQMGNNFGDAYHIEMPVHDVCVSEFSIGKFDVTRGAFRKFIDDTGYRTEAEKGDGCYVYDGKSWRKDPAANWRSPGFSQDDDHPVVCVSWNDSVAYAQWLSRKNNRNYRLPTEAEWEYAARSGGKREKFAGSDDIDAVAWYSGNSGNRTHPVGQKRANGLGLYDMSGNVWQWTADWYDENYYRESPRSNPGGPLSGSKRVFRGGSWFYDPRGVRASYRDFYVPGYRSSYLGFRLVSPVRPRPGKCVPIERLRNLESGNTLKTVCHSARVMK
jgi:formylglycine-generating enzyme required for sulfatase activity